MPATGQLPSLSPDQQTAHRELADERSRLIGEARALIDRAESEKRSLSAEEQGTYDRLFAAAEEARDKMGTIERKARLAILEADDRQRSEEVDRGDRDRSAGASTGSRGERTTSLREADDRRRYESFGQYLAGGVESMSWDRRRDLTIGTGAEGGYLAPTQFVNELWQTIANETPLWNLVRKTRVDVGFQAMIPIRKNRLARFTWTSEKSAGNEDSTKPYGMRLFSLHDCGGYIDVSNKLLRQAAIDVNADVTRELGQAGAETIEEALLTGTGAGQPLGIFTDGVSTDRDFVGDNTATTIKGDSLIDAWFGLKEGYQRRAAWLLSRTAMSQVQKLKSGDGVYLWSAPGRDVSAAFNGSIFGRPTYLSEHVPATFTTGKYVACVAAFDVLYRVFWTDQIEVSRNPYLMQDQNLTRFYGRLELDGAPGIDEAISRIKLG